jgi:hypothetical protein
MDLESSLPIPENSLILWNSTVALPFPLENVSSSYPQAHKFSPIHPRLSPSDYFPKMEIEMKWVFCEVGTES